jgi:hypothetical protein
MKFNNPYRWSNLSSGVFALLILFAGMAAKYSPSNASEGAEIVKAKQFAAQNVVNYFDPSLESMECADFMLTPALLMQEVISDDRVISYPED